MQSADNPSQNGCQREPRPASPSQTIGDVLRAQLAERSNAPAVWVAPHKYRSFSEVFEVVGAQWKLIAHAVRHAESFVVAGYGFPIEDQYGRFLLKEAMRHRTALPTVEFYELDEHADRTRAAICSAFGCAKLRPKHKGPVEPGRLRRPTS